jgi:glycosyltransferase involved in cell wall biosynthesis
MFFYFFNKKIMNTIFIQIASYRDPQLKPTIDDCIKNAKYPNNLVFGITNQYHPDDEFNIDEYQQDERFRIENILYSESKGACWARNLLQQRYSGETYTLQIDSHMRFTPNWDVEMIKMIKQLQKKGFKKPLLTGYVSSFDPDNDPAARVQEPWRMSFDRFIPESPVFFLPETIPGWQQLTEPVPARFYSAHFCFTLGQFCKEVPHDENYYFHGEEISVGVRAFTWGYSLFHPHKVLIWHEYTRKGRIKSWDDDKKWVDKNNSSHLRNRKLFSMDGEIYNPEEFGIYGFGSERTLKDYEIYSGLRFSRRAVQQYTLDKYYPPNPTIYETEEDWENSFATIFKHCIDIGFHQVPEKDYDFWVVAFHGENDETIFRKDADINEINMMMKDPDGYCKIWREFQTIHKPKYWVVWPHSISKDWCERISGNL